MKGDQNNSGGDDSDSRRCTPPRQLLRPYRRVRSNPLFFSGSSNFDPVQGLTSRRSSGTTAPAPVDASSYDLVFTSDLRSSPPAKPVDSKATKAATHQPESTLKSKPDNKPSTTWSSSRKAHVIDGHNTHLKYRYHRKQKELWTRALNLTKKRQQNQQQQQQQQEAHQQTNPIISNSTTETDRSKMTKYLDTCDREIANCKQELDSIKRERLSRKSETDENYPY